MFIYLCYRYNSKRVSYFGSTDKFEIGLKFFYRFVVFMSVCRQHMTYRYINMFIGTIPSELSDLSELLALKMLNNSLTGTVVMSINVPRSPY